jgi:glycerol dehydrogenase-like iron-containing ADH family enzyme
MVGILVDGFQWMVVAGTSSPASGGEHLISHFLDVQSSLLRTEPPSFHA